METISIIIPCYNEEEAIPVYYETMVRQMDEMEEQQKVQFELIFVDDGSKDHSLFEMRRLAQKDMRCRYLSFSRNFGKEAAMYAGLQAAKGDYVTVMDVELSSRSAKISGRFMAWICCSSPIPSRRIQKSSQPPSLTVIFFSLFMIYSSGISAGSPILLIIFLLILP